MIVRRLRVGLLLLAVQAAGCLPGCAPTLKFSGPTPEASPPPAQATRPAPADVVGTNLNVALPAGDSAHGEQLFFGQENGKYPCSACHSLTGQVLVGPTLSGIGGAAASRRDGYSAEKYLHESIVAPDAYVAKGFAPPSVMPGTYGQQMSKQDLADLIAFLISQK